MSWGPVHPELGKVNIMTGHNNINFNILFDDLTVIFTQKSLFLEEGFEVVFWFGILIKCTTLHWFCIIFHSLNFELFV